MLRAYKVLFVGSLGVFLAGGQASAQVADTGFAAVQGRGKAAMGVDQYTSTHQFDALADGGRIELQRDAADSAGVAQIRKHLREIVAAFKAGDFKTPAFVHGRDVPGTAVMAAKRGKITYTFNPLPRGGEVRIVTRDPEALKAIQEFMTFQRQDHHAGGMDHGAMHRGPMPEMRMGPAGPGTRQQAGGMMMGGPMGMMMRGDSAFQADMSVVHELLMYHTAISRTVTLLPNGIRTVTESDNPEVAAFIIGHVAKMGQRLEAGSLFNLVSPNLPTIFQNKDRLHTDIRPTAKGVAFTQTSDDAVTVAALQAHAAEVSELVRDGMIALMRNGAMMGPMMHRP